MKLLSAFLGVSLSIIQLSHVSPTVPVIDTPLTNGRVSLIVNSKLLKSDRLRLVEADAQGKKVVTLLIAAIPSASETFARAAIDLGGKVQYRDDDVGYLRVKMPVENVDQISQSPDIEAINIDGSVDYLGTQSNEALSSGTSQSRIPPPNRDTPPENPYLPSSYIGAPQFIAEHRTFDGRGVTIAIVDTGIDLLLPELQTAKTLDGKATRKFADVLTAVPSAIDPSDDDGFLSCSLKVEMSEQITTKDGKLKYNGAVYSAPGEGDYRIGGLNERVSDQKGDLNRDGNPAGSSGIFAVLWDEKTNTVWVDTNQDYDFTDEKAMTDYRLRYDVGIFGKDNPKTEIRETVGFTVQTDLQHKLIFINPGYGEHGTGVTGAAVGKGFFRGRLNGVAPEAQVVSIPYVGREQNIAHALIESIIIAVKHPQVDIVSVQAGVHRALNDGGSVLSIICDRLVEKYQKPIFKSASNASNQLNAIEESAAAGKVIAVGSYINRETSRVNYGVTTAREDNIDIGSSRGPRKDGGLKPNILAPTMSLSTKPGFLPGGENRSGTYTLPVGYQVYGGTSTAAPMAAAAAALLISASKQSGVRYDAERLRWAIMSSARYLPGYAAHEQGPGLFQVGAAWQALKSAPENVEIKSRAPVNAVLSQYLNKPNQGVGIFEREGWTAGQSDQRIITFTRTTGSAWPRTYTLRWTGNDGTFSSPSMLALPLNQSVTLPIKINPKTSGVHSAILNLDERGAARAVYQVLNTVVAAEDFVEAKRFRITHEGEAEWMDSRSYFFRVPAGAPVFNVDVDIAFGNVMPVLMRPSAAWYRELSGYPAQFTAYQTGGSWSRVIARPEPGVWQLIIDNKNIWDRSRFAAQNLASRNRTAFTVNATLLGVRLDPALVTVSSTQVSTSFTKEIGSVNQLGSFIGGVTVAPLGSGFTEQPLLTAEGMPKVYEINVPLGATRVNARIGAVSDVRADLDLYLFDCSGKECVLKDFSQRDGSNEQVEAENPAPGKWKVLIDPFSVPSGRVSCDYQDIFTHSALGSVTPTEKPAQRVSGARWIERVNIRVNAVPIRPRYLAGLIVVTTEVGPNKGDQQPTGNRQVVYSGHAVLGVTSIEMKNKSRPQSPIN